MFWRSDKRSQNDNYISQGASRFSPLHRCLAFCFLVLLVTSPRLLSHGICDVTSDEMTKFGCDVVFFVDKGSAVLKVLVEFLLAFWHKYPQTKMRVFSIFVTFVSAIGYRIHLYCVPSSSLLINLFNKISTPTN